MPAPDPGKAFHPTTLNTPEPTRILALHGELDFDQRLHLRQALATEFEARPPLLVLDLSDLKFCQSAWLNELLRAHHNPYAVPIVLAAPGPQLPPLLDLTEAGLTMTDSICAALEHHGPSPT
ncbi:STAS domain-containing protein [Streptomyces sp. TLI_171]|uniref:STAS domain-containing protein n=1 Tax=Streptomyces sp. TLI_171 TaxID=1938859 RepID=UPI000C19B5FD|nr:STAS domain-containing protein [Streptomyces sp. TLI_171]RKE05048.1 anti-anti-sigma regulatory factor [Streptomyces sp. TLI_171]